MSPPGRGAGAALVTSQHRHPEHLDEATAKRHSGPSVVVATDGNRRDRLRRELRAALNRDDPLAIQVCQQKLARTAPRRRLQTDQPETPAGLAGVSPDPPTGSPARRRTGRRRHTNRGPK